MRNLLFALLLLVTPVVQARTILLVVAHPDDETTVGPLLAKYAKAGHSVYLLSMTSGQKGVTPNTTLSGDALGAAREGELRCSARNLGIQPPILLGYQDQGIGTPPIMDEIAARLRKVIAETKPDVIITWGPDGLTGHPDHRTAGNLATQVFQQRALLEHKPRKLYYIAFPESRFTPPPPPFERAQLRLTSDAFITTVVNAAPFMDAAWGAIQCHKTQWNAERMKLMDAMNREVFKQRVHLRLAMGDTKARGNETDILEGLD